MDTYSCSRQFVDELRPVLESGDADLLVRRLHDYPSATLREFLSYGSQDAAKVALFCMSFVGKPDDCPAIARSLHCDDAYTVKLAENALWSIWLRGGDERANVRMWQAVEMIADEQLDDALEALSALLREYSGFAEAYHQRSIVHFLREDYEAAREDLEHTLELNPLHFAAMAAMGHCYAAEGCRSKAIAWYGKALRVHPGIEGLPGAVAELTRTAGDSSPDLGRAPLRPK